MLIRYAWYVGGCKDVSFFQFFEFRRMRRPKPPVDQVFDDGSGTCTEMNEIHWSKVLQHFDAACNVVVRDVHQPETLSVYLELRKMSRLSLTC
jgi:hypothetical protein